MAARNGKAPKIETSTQLNSDTKKPEALFADVIKNISRFNNELQDLINNYEQFKKTQNSLENFDDSESDAEGGRVNRNSKNYVSNKGDRSVKTSTTLKYQTEMIYVEKEAGKSSEPEKSAESEKNAESEKSSQSQLNNEVEKSHEVESRKPMYQTNKYKLKVHKTTTQVNEEPRASKEETEPENQEFVEIHKWMKITPDRKKRIIPQAAVQQAPKKTKYSEKETQIKYLSHDSSESDSSVDIDQHTEDEEVGVNKPKERAYEKDNDVTHVTAGIYLRSQNNRTNDTTTIKKIDNDISLEFTDDDDALSKDLFQTSVLRQAYGDSCLKLVIRKCYRACKSAYSSSCQAIKCNSELKKYFDKSSRRGCIDAFNASSKGDDSYNLRRIIGPNALNGRIMTREGYLSMACQTQIEKQTRRMSNNTKIQNGEPLNILRDRYEKACQKISQKKCGKACQYALTATCDKFKCRKRLKKNLKRNCRLDCKIAYSNNAQKSSNSDDNSDDDTDDDSDAASDDESDDSNDDDDDDTDDDDEDES